MNAQLFLNSLMTLFFAIAAPLSASASVLHFECAVKGNDSSGVSVRVDAQDFNTNPSPIVAQVEAFRDGVQVLSATNAMIVERIKILKNYPRQGKVSWAMKLDLGRSGWIFMGFNPSQRSWDLQVQTVELQIPSSVDNAICSVVDDSGMGH